MPCLGLVAGLAAQGRVAEAVSVSLFVEVDERVRIYVLQFSLGGMADVDFVAAFKVAPLCLSVEPCLHLRRVDVELVAFDVNGAASAARLFAVSEVADFERGLQTCSPSLFFFSLAAVWSRICLAV